MCSRAASIGTATGTAWSDWTVWLEGQGAVEMEHPQIAQLSEQRIRDLGITIHAANGKPFNIAWWAQGIAIEFEKDHGLREDGQESTGACAVSASKTLAGTFDEAL